MNGRPVSAFHLSSLRPPGRAAPFAAILIALFAITPLASAQDSARPILLSDDGAWCWFQDERALVHGRTLLVGAVANGTSDKSRRGDIDLLSCDLDSRRVTRVELHDQLEADDHAAPALLRLPDGRLLARVCGTPLSRVSASATSAAWLKPRDQSRQRWSGTGTSSASSSPTSARSGGNISPAISRA